MIIDIGNIIIDKIKDLPFVDKYAGAVKSISLKVKVAEDKFEVRQFPAACQITVDECENEGRYKNLVPDSAKRSVMYLEDKGISFVSMTGSVIKFRGNYDLVCWLNMPRLGFTDCSYSAIAIAGIISKLPQTPFQVGNYQKIKIVPQGQSPKSINPFVKYYREEIIQYLMFPYDFFVLPVSVEFEINAKCVESTPLGDIDECLAPEPLTINYAKIKDQDGNIVTLLKAGETYNVIIASGIDEGGPSQEYTILVTDIN